MIFGVFKSSIKKVKKESILSMVCVVFESAFEIIVPLMMARLIDFGIEKNNMSEITKYGLIIIVLVILEALFGCLCAVFAIKASTVFAKDLRSRLFEKIQTFAFANIDKFSTGSLVTRSTTDITNVQRAFQMLIRGAIRAIGMTMFSLILTYTIYTKLAIIFTCMMPVVVASFVLISKFAEPYFEKMFDAFDKLNNVMSENIHNMRVVKTFNREDYELDKMKKTSDDIYGYSVKAETHVALWDPFMNISMYIILILISWIGAKAIIASGNNPALGLTTGQLMSLITYGMQMLMSLMFISMIYVMLVISRASIERVGEVLTEDAKIKNKENPIKDIVDGSIEFDNVSFKYSENAKNRVLKDISLKINSGEMIGIIGGTGSGKSSLVNLIPRLYDVSFGKIMVGGQNVKDYDLKTLRGAIGIVLQKNVLFSGTIASNLRFGNEHATIDEMKEACEIACAMDFINEKEDGFDTKVEQGGTNFSGGQKQRLSIARTILKKPKIIIFDDSTSAVDTKTDAHIRDGLKNKLKDTTKIIISQRIISIKECDRIIVMDNGRIVAFDTHESLLNNCKLYKDIYDIQNS
ncbi:MAG: ABC transporter ATP-binding protein [Lachnospiraceae bacterium]|nr:ABC transporter ATP-binding protein [Lachnospiraceae bacterium]